MNIFQFLTCLTDDMTCLAAPSQSMNRSGKINAGTRHRKGISDAWKKRDLLHYIALDCVTYVCTLVTCRSHFYFFQSSFKLCHILSRFHTKDHLITCSMVHTVTMCMKLSTRNCVSMSGQDQALVRVTLN